MWRFTFSISLFFLAYASVCQPPPQSAEGGENRSEQAPASTEPPKAKEPVDLKPYEWQAGLNVLRSGQTLLGGGISTHELSSSLAFHHYLFALDVGMENNERSADYRYTSRGSYWRAGLDRNFVKNKQSGEVLSLGLRYARASFSDELFYELDIPGFEDSELLLENTDLTARWLEVTVNLRGRLLSNLYSGFTLRWQFGRSIAGQGELQAYDVPGFGITKRQNSTAFDYYLIWRIPFSKKSNPEVEE